VSLQFTKLPYLILAQLVTVSLFV